jgi:pimeloyl-ACP methyl ester carboxylesterase
MESRFASYDGTEIGYRVLGDGPPLICLPGGPGRVGKYLGDLGGLHTRRRLIIPDTRGTGLSADPADPESFRVDRLVPDVEALRAHLGLDQVDLLAHSAAATLGVLYAAAHPERIAALILVTPALPVLGIDGDEAETRAVLARRSGEPWYRGALAAMEKAAAGDRSPEVSVAITPFYYGRWDAAARRHSTAGISARNRAARDGYWAGVTFDPPATRAAIAKLTAPVLLHAGEADAFPTVTEVRQAAALFPGASVTVQPGAGHFPWVDDPAEFATAVGSFLGESRLSVRDKGCSPAAERSVPVRRRRCWRGQSPTGPSRCPLAAWPGSRTCYRWVPLRQPGAAPTPSGTAART